MPTKQEAKKVSLKYKIDSIKLINFFERNYENYNLTPEDIHVCELEYKLGLHINPEEEIIKLRIGATYYVTTNDERKELFGIETEYTFKCYDFKNKFPSKTDGSVDIPDNFMKELIEIAFHGTRGMMFTQTNIPEYKKMTLPLIDLSECLKGLHQQKQET